MGYYNDVVIVCDEKTCKEIVNVCEKVSFYPSEFLSSKSGNFKLRWRDTKWGYVYDTTQHIDNILKRLNDEDFEVGRFAVFVRNGEDWGDMEFNHFGDEDVAYDFFVDVIVDITNGWDVWKEVDRCTQFNTEKRECS